MHATLSYYIRYYIIICIVSKLAVSLSSPKFCTSSNEQRLPTNAIPLKYKLHIEVDATLTRYMGTVDIFIENNIKPASLFQKLTKSSNENQVEPNKIVLHADTWVDISKINYFDLGQDMKSETSSQIEIVDMCRSSRLQKLQLTLKESIKPKTKGLVRIEFSGIIRKQTDQKGFFSVDRLVNDDRFPMAVTQFHPFNARLMFPCFDEPQFRASFELSIKHLSDFAVISNTRHASVDLIGTDRKITKFVETQPIPVHSFAFALGRFARLTGRLKSGIKVVVLTAPGRQQQAKFALETAIFGLEYMEKYTSVPFLADEFTMMAVPHKIEPMTKSWGLVTIQESLLLVDDESDPEAKVMAALAILQAISGQWAGILVGPNWWTDNWLFEGLALKIALEMVEVIYPHFGSQYFFRMEKLSPILDLDKMKLLVPMQQMRLEKMNNNQAQEVLNEIESIKSVYVLQQIQLVTSAEYFKSGLSLWLKKNMFNTLNTESFVQTLENEVQKDISILDDISTWLTARSFPFVTLSHMGGDEFVIDQLPFEIELFEDTGISTWNLHLEVQFADTTSEKYELRSIKMNSRQLIIEAPSWFDIDKQGHYVKINPTLSSYFRVGYSPKILSSFKEAIRTKKMSPAQRLILLNDANSLLKAKKISNIDYERLLSFFTNEDHGAVLLELLQSIKLLDELELESSSIEANLNACFETYFDLFNGFETVESGSLIEMSARQAIFRHLVELRNSRVIDAALKTYDRYDGKSLPAFLREPIYLAVAKDGSSKQVSSLSDRLISTQSPAEMERIGYILLARRTTSLKTK